MEEIKRIYLLLLENDGLRLRDIAEKLELDKYHLAELMFSDECNPYWYQNDFSLWFAKEGAIEIEEPEDDRLAKSNIVVSTSQLEKYVYVENGKALQAYIEQVLSFPTYTYDETIELFERYRDGDEKAFEMLVKGHLNLVVNLARLYRHRGAAFEDLIQEGNIGLITAISKYDHTSRISFLDYAKRGILNSIRNSIYELPYLIHFPPNAIVKHYRIHRLLDKLEQEYGFEPPIPDDAEYIFGNKDFSVYERLPYDLLTMTQGDDCDLYEGDCQTDKVLMDESLTKNLKRLLSTLSDREAIIVEFYFGITRDEKNLEKIAQIYRLTRERVRQILFKAIRRISKRTRFIIQMTE